MTARRSATTALAVLVVASISSCSGASDRPTASSAPVSSSTPSEGRTSASPDPAEEAKSQAVALIPTYLGTLDDLYLDATRPLDDVYTVAVDAEATAEAAAIGSFRAQGYQQVGRSRLVSAHADTIDLATDAAATSPPVLPSVGITACVDVSQVQATDRSGLSVIPSGRPGYLVAQLTVVNINYPDPGSWRVSEAPNTQAQSCDG